MFWHIQEIPFWLSTVFIAVAEIWWFHSIRLARTIQTESLLSPFIFCLLGHKHVGKFWLTQSDSLCSYFEIRISNLHGTPPTYPVLYWKLKVDWRPHSRVNTQQGTDERRKSSRFPFWFQISATEAETTWKWRPSKKENWTLLLWSIARMSTSQTR